MNAIISICHFCELHGPNIVFCTQAFRDLLDLDALADVGTAEIINSDQRQVEDQLKTGETDLWKYGRISKETNAQAKYTTSSDSCVACRSFPHNQPGFISNDDSARVSYVSSQYPLQSELYVLVRQACIRSLSCEVCPGKEGPIYFGDEARGHVLSHTFFLRDVQARGFQRWYSILVLMKDKMLLLNSWPFLERNLQQTIIKLQESASKIYEDEEAKVSHRSLRSAVSMMENVRRQRVAGQPRSFSELVGEGDVWQHLHTSFTWLLKAGGLRLQERLVEGPPVNVYVIEGSDIPAGVSVRQLYEVFGVSTFHHLLHHLLIGRQIILRGSSSSVITAVVRSLQPLLPKHCYKAVSFSPHYVDSVSCNVLGLHYLVKIPQVVMGSGNLCLVDVVAKEEYSSKQESQSTEEDIKEVIKKFTFKISREGSLPNRPPQVLSRIESAVSNSTLTQSTLMLYISTILYEWINKVKVWIHVQNLKKTTQATPERVPSPVPHSQPIFRSPTIPILRSPTHSLSRSPVLHTFRSVSPGTLGANVSEVSPPDERYQLLAALGSTEWDVPLLEFWAKNFNKSHMQEVC